MGFLLCALLWGVVLLEEIERIPAAEWKKDGLKKVLLLRRPRNRTVFLLALAVGAFCLYVEALTVWAGRSSFDLDQALSLYGIVLGGYLYAVNKKGRR